MKTDLQALYSTCHRRSTDVVNNISDISNKHVLFNCSNQSAYFSLSLQANMDVKCLK